MAESPRERALVKLRTPLEVRFKFLSKTRQEAEQEQVYEGTAPAISAQGCLLAGKIPKFDWLTDLLTQKMMLGINLLLPHDPDPIKVLGEVGWIERIDEATGRCQIGVTFKDIQAADRSKIFAHQVKAQLPSG
ncbi:MAG: PilZ domain-containing protein [Planctomycetes bacterium]|nr:PilZ domain-containing protein [Planctomycetota bacterium]